MGMFDDLVPQKAAAPAPQQYSGMFSDMIQQGTQQPSTMDTLRASPLGGAAQTVLRAGQGVQQLISHLPSPFSAIDPEMGREKAAIAERVDRSIAEQNRGYQENKMRVAEASGDPRLFLAMTGTGEDMAHLANPAGAVGATLPGAIGRGMASASGFAASQPITNPEADFWAEKAKQQAMAIPVGAGMGALSQAGSPKPPTAKELKKQASDAYKSARESGATVEAKSFLSAIDEAESGARKDLTYRPATHPKAATAIGLIREEMGQAGERLSLDDVEVARRLASSALDSPSKGERAVAHRIIDKIDDYVGGLDDTFAEARALFARSAKSATMERLQEKAKNTVGANYTQAGYETALRQQFRSLLNNENAMRRFSPEEKGAIEKVVRGGPVENALRMVGRFAVRGPVGGSMYGGAAYFSGQPEIALGLAGAGELGRQGATQMTMRNVRIADELMRRGPTPEVPGPVPNVPVGNASLPLIIEALLRPQRAQ